MEPDTVHVRFRVTSAVGAHRIATLPAVFGRHKRAGDLFCREKARQPGDTEPCETFNVIVGAAMACRRCCNLPDALAAMSEGNRDPNAGQ